MVRMSQQWNRLSAEAAETPLLEDLNQVREILSKIFWAELIPPWGREMDAMTLARSSPALWAVTLWSRSA